ncbi:MAG TPA: alpha-glucan family phosphorylase, partial [Cytophagales bacterium]
QPFKVYSGGLGFLAGSHMRSAYDLKQNLVGIGILWKYGYYDQVRRGDQTMDVLFQEKLYGFLVDTGLRFDIQVNNVPVKVAAWYLPPDVFGSAPLFFLSTDLPENDYLARTICHRLYDSNTEAKIAASVLLGVGGGKLLDLIGFQPETYHLNEAHALPLAFYLFEKYGKKREVRQRMVFTTHTPVEAGNDRTHLGLLAKMNFFGNLSLDEVRKQTGTLGDIFDHTLGALRFARLANGVSKMHGEVARQMWSKHTDVCPILHVTNAQNRRYWADKTMYEALEAGDDEALRERKRERKRQLFEEVADQCGEIYDPNVLTIVWARRFADYKRADLLMRDLARFQALINHQEMPVQIIWAGKPYPQDFQAVSIYNRIVETTKGYPNCAVLVGHELRLSRLLKGGADVWLNNPRITREASGTSGMTAAMNGGVNLSVPDGWIPEFARHGENSFVVPPADALSPLHEQDEFDGNNLMNTLENEILPLYYRQPNRWLHVVKNSMRDILPFFDSDRMAGEYYGKMY